jgi:transcriptional regulator of arginine metabolism
VERERLSSQHEIRARLKEQGIDATQSTISRDVEELGLARVHDADGLRYVVPGNGSNGGTVRLRRLLDEFALSFAASGNLLVVRTPPGAAAALGEGLDSAALPEIAGTVAGDNTILIVASEGLGAHDVERRLRTYMEVS